MVPVRVMVTDCPAARLSPLQTPWPGRSCPRLGVPKTGLSRAAGTASVRLTLLTVLGAGVADRDGVGVGRARHGQRDLAVGLGDRQVGLGRQRVGVAAAGRRPRGGVTVAVLTRVPVAVGVDGGREAEGDGGADGQVDGGGQGAAAADAAR